MDPSQVEVRDAATVVILRDGLEGIEAFMLRRNLDSDFVGGAHVFPGGAVDPADRHADLEAVCQGRSDIDASALLGIGQGGLAYWVAAIRESFEEAGVLLAYDRTGAVVDLDHEAGRARWAEHRTAVDRGERRLIDVCRAEDLRLAVGAMHYFGHWITPEGPPRRYDTRFFLAAAPPNQTPLHDDREVIANDWFRPADALARAAAGSLVMLPPTVACLRAVARFDRAEDVLAEAGGITGEPAVLPRMIRADGGLRIVLPGDPGHDGGTVAPDAPSTWHELDHRRTTGFGAGVAP